ncbi:MAG: aminoacyl-tRNA hydrolase [Phycisphaerae bacterium]
MKLIVGLGNPGKQYAETRHNAGFMAVDALAQRWQIAVDTFDKRTDALVAEAQRNGQRVFLLKPMTYMNLSGRSVAAFVRFYKLTHQDVLVLFDDMDLPVGRIRVRTSGSAGGQKGMADIIRHLGTDDVARVRIGIGRQQGGTTTDHVLSKFDARDRDEIAASLALAADAAACWLTEGAVAAMNQFNGQDPRDRASQN